MYGGYHRDMRRFQRLRVNLSVFYRIESPENTRLILGGFEQEADMIDLSEGGMAFLARRNIPPHTILLVKFILFKFDSNGIVSFSDPLEVHAEVRYCISAENNEYRLGVCFRKVEGNEKAEISDFVTSTAKPSTAS